MSHHESLHSPILYIDCFSGISGDMTLGALMDLGSDVESTIRENLSHLGELGFNLRVEKTHRNGIAANQVHVKIEADQPARSFTQIRDLIEGSDLAHGVKDRAIEMFQALTHAEGKVHDSPPEKVHFHEVGAVDSIVDIVGIASGLEHLSAKLWCSHVPLGRGFVNCQHGTIPVPAPATLALLRGVPVYGTDVPYELVTPTGATLIATQVSGFGPLPAMRPKEIGWGSGSRHRPERPGLLRLVLGEATDDSSDKDCVVIEANIDDMTAELAAHTIDRALEAGALDAWISPITMKKGRPAMKLGVLTTVSERHKLTNLLLRETTSIGLRFYEVGRVTLPRKMVEVETPFGKIPVKIAEGPGEHQNIAPEFDACQKAAERHHVPLKEVLAQAAAAAHSGKTLSKKHHHGHHH